MVSQPETDVSVSSVLTKTRAYALMYHGLVLAWYVMVAQLIDVQIFRSSVRLGAVTSAALLIVIFVLLIQRRESAYHICMQNRVQIRRRKRHVRWVRRANDGG